MSEPAQLNIDKMGEPATISLIRVQMYLKKKDGITDEQFHKHWAHNHVKIALEHSNFVDRIVRYNQYHTSPALKEIASKFNMPVPDYDGIAEIWVKSLEDFANTMSDPGFAKAIAEDEELFLQRPLHVMIGYDHTVIGEPVKER